MKSKSDLLQEAYEYKFATQKYERSVLFNTYEPVALDAMAAYAEQEKKILSDQFLSYLDEEIKRFSRLAANERGNEYHRFDEHRAACIKAKEKFLQLTNIQLNESKGQRTNIY